jgi:hypothetical protein
VSQRHYKRCQPLVQFATPRHSIASPFEKLAPYELLASSFGNPKKITNPPK